MPYLKSRQESSCSPCCQASHFQADYFMCFIKFDVRKCFQFKRAVSALYPGLIPRLWPQISSRHGRLEKSLLAMLLVIQIKMVHGHM